MAETTWNTRITKIEPNRIQVRGYPVDRMMGNISFSQAIYLILTGKLPSQEVGKLIDAILVSSIDHGVTPPSTQAALTAASTGAPLNTALSAGILSINVYHGGAIQGCMEFLQLVELQLEFHNFKVDAAVNDVVQGYREKRKRVPGFGHRLHTSDPRSKALFELADSLELSNRYVSIARATETYIARNLKKPLPINVDGAIAALLCDLDIPKELANAFFIMARVPGLVAHIYEEQSSERPMRRIDPRECQYTGPENLKL